MYLVGLLPGASSISAGLMRSGALLRKGNSRDHIFLRYRKPRQEPSVLVVFFSAFRVRVKGGTRTREIGS